MTKISNSYNKSYKKEFIIIAEKKKFRVTSFSGSSKTNPKYILAMAVVILLKMLVH